MLAGAAILGFVTVTFIFLNESETVQAENPDILFSLLDSPKVMPDDQKLSPASVRESEITFDFNNLVNQNLQKINLPLFDKQIYQAVQTKSEGLEKRSEDNFTWRGKITKKDFSGDVVLTFNQGTVNGLIYSPTAVYEITTKGNRHFLVELDQGLFPDCAGEVKPETKQDSMQTSKFGVVSDSADRIDVLVVYTEAVKTAVGGDTQAQNLAQSAIDITNTAYRNSKIRQRLNLVHSEQTALTEANSLSNLRADAPTQALRNTHNADMVAMLVNSLGGCGIGYLMTSVGSGFASSAYSITLRTCAVGNLTFAHELGHNMGSAHDPANGGASAYPYSFGHFVDGSYRTVMSYSNQCTSGCTRVPQFSNPAISFNNAATGLLNTRNNARSIENTADTVANFRYSGSSITLNNYNENVYIPRNISKTVNWSSNNLTGNVKIEISRDEGTTWETLIASTANDGNESISIGGRPTKRVRLRINSLNNTGVSDSSIRNISIK
jgi:hypothetical protein